MSIAYLRTLLRYRFFVPVEAAIAAPVWDTPTMVWDEFTWDV